MALIIEAPEIAENFDNNKSIKLFLAGGISNVSDWQSFVVDKLKNIENLIIFNPRRKKFDTSDYKVMEEQIKWEYNFLRISDIISFWFAKETLNPITLYELGKWGNSTDKKLVIGIEPTYQRKDDVIIQTNLARPEIKEFYFDLEKFSEALVNKINSMKSNKL